MVLLPRLPTPSWRSPYVQLQLWNLAMCLFDCKCTHVYCRSQQKWLNIVNAAAKCLQHCDQACHRNMPEKLPHEHCEKSITFHLHRVGSRINIWLSKNKFKHAFILTNAWFDIHGRIWLQGMVLTSTCNFKSVLELQLTKQQQQQQQKLSLLLQEGIQGSKAIPTFILQ
jgi:hypothetical protein